MNTTTPADQIAHLVETTEGTFNPLHEVMDSAKVAHLCADMLAHGWRGAPLVVDSENAFTGAHRIAAAHRALRVDGTQITIPYVEISELCELFDIDWAELLTDYDGDTYEAARTLRYKLPREVVDYLGYDVDGAL